MLRLQRRPPIGMMSAVPRRSESLLGVGVYNVLEASRLLAIDARTLERWSSSSKAGPALVEPTHGFAYSFHDLLSLAVIAVLRQRKVTPRGVRASLEYLTEALGYAKPFAHEEVVAVLATAGSSLIHADDEVDVSRRGQGVLLGTVTAYLKPVEYGSDRLARLWRPAKRVLVDPEVQVGHPCIEGTRITTETVAGRFGQGEPLSVIAADLRVDAHDARAAVAFERRLEEGKGLALVA